MCVKVKLFPAGCSLSVAANTCASRHTSTHSHTRADTLTDRCTEKGIGDFIDESLKSSLKQNKMFTSQLESNGVMTVVLPFSDDK